MKKLLVVLIAIVFVASVVIVNIFGLQFNVGLPTVYVQTINIKHIEIQRDGEIEEITATKSEVKDSGITEYQFYFNFTAPEFGEIYPSDEASLIENPNRVAIIYEVVPADANNRDITYEFDADQINGVAVYDEETNTIVFLRKNRAVSVLIKAEDSGKILCSIYIRAK